jgi:hypothetical protein
VADGPREPRLAAGPVTVGRSFSAALPRLQASGDSCGDRLSGARIRMPVPRESPRLVHFSSFFLDTEMRHDDERRRPARARFTVAPSTSRVIVTPRSPVSRVRYGTSRPASDTFRP